MLALSLAAGAARADDAPAVRESAETPGAQPWLHLDPDVLLDLRPLGAAEMTDHATFGLGSRGRLALTGSSWSNEDANLDGRAAIDLVARGWNVRAQLVYDLGPFDVRAWSELANVDYNVGRGYYLDAGVSIGRTKRLSRWTTAWISLGLVHRRWLGDEQPLGESDDTQLRLSLGFTF